MKIIELLIEYTNHSLDRPFSYVYFGNKPVGKGYRVLITFNNRTLVGYVLNAEETDKTKNEVEDELGFKMLEIIDVLDDKPLLDDDLLSLANALADYYLSPKISVLQTMLPPSLKPARSSLGKPKIAFDKYLEVVDDDEEGLTAKQIEILRMVKKEKSILKKEIKSQSVVDKLLKIGKLKIVDRKSVV